MLIDTKGEEFPTAISREEKWRSHMESYEESGLSQLEYCRRSDISYSSFQYWRNRLKSGASSESLTFVRLVEDNYRLKGDSRNSCARSSVIRVWVKDFCLEVGDSFSSDTFCRLVETLRRL